MLLVLLPEPSPPYPTVTIAVHCRSGKEYAKADSRYATRDAFIVQMEGVTAFAWGPACFLIVYGILYRKAFRFAAMLLVSLGQLYGDVLYYLTCYHEGGCGAKWSGLPSEWGRDAAWDSGCVKVLGVEDGFRRASLRVGFGICAVGWMLCCHVRQVQDGEHGLNADMRATSRNGTRAI